MNGIYCQNGWFLLQRTGSFVVLLDDRYRNEGMMHTTQIVICRPDALGRLTWITDHSHAAIQQRIQEAQRTGVFQFSLSRAEIRYLDRCTEGLFSKMLDRSGDVYRERPLPTDQLEMLEGCASRLSEHSTYRAWLSTFIDAVTRARSLHRAYRMFIR